MTLDAPEIERLEPCTSASRAERADQTVEVSILIKALNEAPNIERCIRSCLAALEGIAGEVIVADSLSDDSTVEIAARWPVRIIQLKRRRDRGCGVAAQLAFQHASGRFLYVIDGDMELPPGFLREALEFLKREPKIGGVAGQLQEVLPESDLSRIRRNRRRLAHAGVGPVNALNGGGLYRRDALDQAGSYLTHPSLHAHEELELALRLRACGWEVVRLPSVSMQHKGHADAAFSLLLRRWRSGYAFGSGELIRAALGKPYFGKVLRHFPFHFLAWGWWLAIVAGLAALPFSPWPAAMVLALSVLVPVAMMIVKRDAFLGLYSVVGWHVFAAGALVGAARFRRGDPGRQIAFVDRSPAGPALAAASAGAEPRPVTTPSANGSAGPPNAGEPSAVAPRQREMRSRDSANPYGREAVKSGLLHFMSGRIFSGVLQLALVALYVRFMVVEEYAAYVTLTAMVGLMSSLTLIGLERAAMRYYPEARLSGGVTGLRHLVRTLTLVRLSFVMTAILLVVLFSEPVMRLLQIESYRSTLWMALAYLLASSTTRYQRYTMQSLMLQRELTQGMVLPLLLRLLVVVGLVLYFGHFSALWGLASMALTEWIQATMQFRAYSVHLRQLRSSSQPGADNWRPNYREISRYALVNGYSSLLRQVSGKYTLRLIGATYLSPAAIAAFGFFQSLSERMRPYLPIFLTRTLIEPVAMAQYLRERDFSKFVRVMSVALKLNLMVIAPLGVWLALSGTPAVSMLTGGKYLDYMWIALLILVSLVSVSHLALLELTANAVTQNTLLAKGSTLAAVLTLGALLGTQPWSGVLGLVLTGLLTSVISNVYVVWQLRRAGFDYRVDLVGDARIVINAGVAAGLGFGLEWMALGRGTFVGSLAALVVTLLVFGALCLVNRPFPTAEWDILKKILPRKLQRRMKL